MPEPALGFVRKSPHDRSSKSIDNLACEDSSWGSLCLYYFVEEVEEVVEPAGGTEIIDKVADSIGPDLKGSQAIKAVVLR